MNDDERILIIDDNETNRMLLNDLIESLGYIPLVAANGREGMTMLRNDRFSLVLLDILMPVMDGYEFLRRWRVDERLRQIPVIVISSVDDMESVVRCIELGAVDYLIKPFNATLLRARIEATLEKKGAHDRERDLHRKLEQSFTALEKAEQMRDFLTQAIVHDLSNPLTALIGYIDLADMDTGAYSGYLSQMKTAADDMLRLVRTILEMSKLENGVLPVASLTVPVSTIVKEETAGFQIRAARTRISISLSTVTADLRCTVDPGLIRRIFQNIMSNALKHAPADTGIAVTLKATATHAVVSVADSGNGIPDRYKKQIFDKYFQIETRNNHESFGVGMGLAFCKLAIEAMNGRIWIEDNHPSGTVVTFSLPLTILADDNRTLPPLAATDEKNPSPCITKLP